MSRPLIALAATVVLSLIAGSGLPGTALLEAQLVPQRARADRPVELTFPAPRHVNLPTNEPLAAGEFHYGILHTFGEVNQGAGSLWGIDSGANIRFTLEYGVTDRWSFHLARSSMDRVFEAGIRVRLLDQSADGSIPLSLGIRGSGGIMTLGEVILGEDPSFLDRTHVALSLPLTRAWNSGVSVALVPMGVRFRRTYEAMRLHDPGDGTLVGMGLGARMKWGPIVSGTMQVVPIRGMDSGEVRTVVGGGLDLETGGHVFQLFLTSSQGIGDAYLLAAPVGEIAQGGLRFGFIVNRSFQLF